MRSPFEHLNNVAITRDNAVLTDGAGSQLQRNYCTYALSRFLNISYIHSPLKKISYQGLTALEKNEEDPELVARYNKVFAIPSDLALPEDPKIYDVEKPDLFFVNTIKEKAKNDQSFHLINAGFPYEISDYHPQMLDWIKEVTPFPFLESPVFRIAIHVRRGELFAVDTNRMLPNSYYLTVVKNILKILAPKNIPFCCELYSEIPSATFTIEHGHDHGLQERIKTYTTISQAMSQLEDFEIIPNLKKCINDDPIDSLRAMATADLLVLSRSSFSYLAAILNQRGFIIYHPFWHNAPAAWANVHDQKLLEEKLHAYCASWHS